MAKKDQKAEKQQSEKPPAQLMDLVESFLSDQGFDNAHREFRKHRATKAWKGHETGESGNKEHNSLVTVFQAWETFASKDSTPNTTTQTTVETITKVSSSSSSDDSSDSSSSDESSDDDSDDDVAMADAPAAESSSSESSSSDSDSDSDSESESDSDEEETKVSKPAAKVAHTIKSLKRKAESDSESSSSESDSESDEDMSRLNAKDAKKPQSKKLKTEDSSDESSSPESSSEPDSSDDSSGDEEDKPKTTKKSESDDDSSSDSDSDSGDSSTSSSDDEVETAAQVPLPESDESSDSESESDKEKVKTETNGKSATGMASDSSATLEKTASPEFAPLPPNPTTFKANNRGNGLNPKRTQNKPFSRISSNVEVDPRLSSNAYVSHGYGEQAHRDLIVTKGKGFTKEKNKKKRGSYKGGPLDVHTSRSFKFED
jgi:hypothetical protein